MTRMEYAQNVAELVNGEAKVIEKANGVKLTGIIAGENAVRPTIYIDYLYDEGAPVEATAEYVRRIVENNNTPDMNLAFLQDFDNVKDKLRLRLYNEQTKADIYEYAEGFNDLIVIPYLENIMQSENGIGSAKVTDSLLKTWGVSRTEVMKIAKENSGPEEYEIKTMAEIMSEMMGGILPPIPGGELMNVITSKNKICGAYGVIALKEQLKEMYPDGYVVLPSSIHEVIVIQKGIGELVAMAEMVQEVNRTQVRPEEVLGHKAYEF